MIIHEVCMEYEANVLYTKGHVEVGEFLKAARLYTGHDDEWFCLKDAHYTWLRHNPDSSGDYACLVVNGTPGKQGTFPATVTFDPGARVQPYERWERMPYA